MTARLEQIRERWERAHLSNPAGITRGDARWLLAEVDRLREKARRRSVIEEADHANDWGMGGGLSYGCQQGGYEHEFCDDPDCTCSCHPSLRDELDDLVDEVVSTIPRPGGPTVNAAAPKPRQPKDGPS